MISVEADTEVAMSSASTRPGSTKAIRRGTTAKQARSGDARKRDEGRCVEVGAQPVDQRYVQRIGQRDGDHELVPRCESEQREDRETDGRNDPAPAWSSAREPEREDEKEERWQRRQVAPQQVGREARCE